MSAMFAYDLPPSRRAASDVKPSSPLRVPMAGCQLSQRETQNLIAFGRANKVGLNGLLSAVLLLAEWRLRGRTNIPLPVRLPGRFALRALSPLSATACTNPLGVASSLAEIDHNTDVVSLARDIVETFRADWPTGSSSSRCCTTARNKSGTARLARYRHVDRRRYGASLTHTARCGMTAAHDELFFAVNAGIDMYLSKVFAGQLVIDTTRMRRTGEIDRDNTFAAL